MNRRAAAKTGYRWTDPSAKETPVWQTREKVSMEPHLIQKAVTIELGVLAGRPKNGGPPAAI